MTKQTLYKVMKISVSKIKRSMKKETYIDKDGNKKKRIVEPHVYNMGTYSYSKAEKLDEIVAIGDNMVFRKLRELKGEMREPNEIYDYVATLNQKIDILKDLKSNKEIIDRMKALEKERDEFLFIPDIINVKVDKKEHYKDVALQMFTVNGITYKRFSCGAGQMRRNTVTFLNVEYYDALYEALMCGLDGLLKEITLAKLSAYFALSFSSVLWVRTPRICVIPDIETVLPQQHIDFIVKNDDGSKDVEERVMDIPLNSCDGEGIIDPVMAELWSKDMGIGYTACQFVIRTAFCKGNLLTFDFRKYLKEVCGKDTIKSIYGEEFNIDEIDVLLTESMFKMHGVYTSVQQYVDFHTKYHLKWGVARYNKKFDEEMSLLNYQYIQNCYLDDDGIDELLQPTVDWFQKICSGDDFYTVMYAIGCAHDNDTFEDIMNNCGSLHTKAIMKNSLMLQDGYVKRKIYNSIKESFRQAKIGRLWAKGNYQFMLADPIPLLRNAVGLDSTGVIGANCVYTQFWSNRDVKTIDAMRSPMVDRHEHNILTVENTEFMQEWFKYLYSGLVYSIYDTSTIRHSDSDFDGDIAFSTDNNVLIKGAYYSNNVITYDKEKAPSREITYENIINCDMDGFDTLVGQITNNSTALNAMLPLFPQDKKPKEHTEILKRLKLLREIIGAEIDKIKLGVSPEFPKEWLERVQIDVDNDTPDEITEKLYRNSLVICKKPYFMIYLYDKLHHSYTNHAQQTNINCKIQFNEHFNDLKYKKNKTKEEQKFVNTANYFSPVLDSPCVMNKICHKMERVQDKINYSKSFKESVLHEFNQHEYKIMKTKLNGLNEIYKKYKARRKFTYMNNLLGDMNLSSDDVKDMIRHSLNNLMRELQYECYDLIGTNTQELFEYMMAREEQFPDDKSVYNSTFVWDILGDKILDVIPDGEHLLYVQTDQDDTDGKEYLGRKFKIMEVNDCEY